MATPLNTGRVGIPEQPSKRDVIANGRAPGSAPTRGMGWNPSSPQRGMGLLLPYPVNKNPLTNPVVAPVFSTPFVPSQRYSGYNRKDFPQKNIQRRVGFVNAYKR